MTKHEADVIGGLNMTDQISNEAYKQIMIAAQDENEPCEDAISREAVLKIYDEWFANCNIADKKESPKSKIKELPPVNPQKPKSEWEHDHEILKAYSDGANAMADKIRAEIEQLTIAEGGDDYVRKMAELFSLKLKVLQIINKCIEEDKA